MKCDEGNNKPDESEGIQESELDGTKVGGDNSGAVEEWNEPSDELLVKEKNTKNVNACADELHELHSHSETAGRRKKSVSIEVDSEESGEEDTIQDEDVPTVQNYIQSVIVQEKVNS